MKGTSAGVEPAWAGSVFCCPPWEFSPASTVAPQHPSILKGRTSDITAAAGVDVIVCKTCSAAPVHVLVPQDLSGPARVPTEKLRFRLRSLHVLPFKNEIPARGMCFVTVTGRPYSGQFKIVANSIANPLIASTPNTIEPTKMTSVWMIRDRKSRYAV